MAETLVAKVVKTRWSGHGEGGTTVSVVIEGWPVQNIYDSTPKDIATAERVCAYVNEVIDAMETLRRMRNG